MPNNYQYLDATGTQKLAEEIFRKLEPHITALQELIRGIDAPVYRTTSPDNPVILSDGYAAPVKSLSVEIPVTQSGEGDPSADNIRPFSGFDSVTITQTGKNLLPFPYTNWGGAGRVIDNKGVTTTINADGSLTLNGTVNSDVWTGGGILNRTPIENTPFKPGGHYILTGGYYTDSKDHCGLYVTCYDSELVRLDSGSATDNAGKTIDLYIPENTAFILISLRITVNTVLNDYVLYPMIRPASTLFDDTFEPYRRQSVTVSTGDAGAVYGGTLDITTGKLTVTHGYISSFNPETDSDIIDGKQWLSSMDVYASGNVPTAGAEIIYPLENLVIYQLTPTEITTLSGVNIIGSDAGDIDVTYRADPALSM